MNRTGAAGMSLFSFEGGVDGWHGTQPSGYFTTSAAGVISADQDAAGSAYQTTVPYNGRGRLRVVTSSSGTNSGAWVDLSSQNGGQTFLAGHAYEIHADLIGWSGNTLAVLFGVDASGVDAATCSSISTTGHWQTLDCTWRPTQDRSSNVHFAVRKNTAGSISIFLDDVVVWDATSSVITQSDIPTSETIYDADSHPIENVTPPGVPGTDEPMVTASAFDPDGRLVSTSVDATDGYSASVLGTSGLLDYWPLDEHGGTAADDRKGSNDGAYTTTGVDLGVAGGVDEARTGAELDGATGRVNVADSSSLDLTGNFSIEYWIKPDATLTTGAPSQWFGGVNKMNAYGIGWEGTDDGWQFKLTAGGVAHAAIASNVTAQAGQWYHIVGTYDGATMRLYVNGVQAASTTVSGLTIDSNANALTLGYMGAYWAGSIDEVALYNTALSSGTVAAHYAAGRETAVDANLVTRNVYDALGRKTDLVDPSGIDTHYVYDRLGRVTAGVSNYVAGATSTPTRNVTALAAYDALGEVIATCSANATAAGCGSTITTSNAAWHYVYDAAGHQVRAVPPVNAVLTALDETATIYDSSGGRVASIVSCAASAGDNCLPSISNSDRHTNLTYDALGRVTSTVVYLGHGTSAPRLTTAAAYDGLGHQLSVKFTSTTQGEDTIESTYDSLGRVSAMYEGPNDPGNPPTDGNAKTQAVTYNPDGTVATRKDYKISSTASTFTYDPLGHLIEATSPTFGSGVRVDFVWRLDGLLASRSWSTGPAALVYGYDGAKRPIKECNGTAGACGGAQIDIERTYDRLGNVLTETQNVSGATVSQNGTQTFIYDALNRVTSSAINDPQSYKVDKSYTYDSDGNRLSVTVNTVNTDTFTFDATDQTISDNAVAFTYDRYGNLTHSSTSAASTTSYAYDLADRLNSITQADGSSVGFTFDAAGRHATRTSGGTTIDTYGYLGTSDSVLADNTVYSALDSMGDRLATKTTSALGWIVPDLHGNVAAQCGSTGSVIDVFRYDAYGKALGTPNSPSSIPTPWRFQGRILESTAGTDTYDFGARSYVPDLGTFTSLDSVAGSAQSPLTLNRYLYANANPATLIDPDGHCSWNPFDGDSCESQPVKFTWETGENAVGFGAGFAYQSPAALVRLGGQVVNLGQTGVGVLQCGVTTSCGVHDLQDAWNTVSSNPDGALRSAWAQDVDSLKQGLGNLANAGVDLTKKYMDCEAANDYFRCGQESAEVATQIIGWGTIAKGVSWLGGKTAASLGGGGTAAATDAAVTSNGTLADAVLADAKAYAATLKPAGIKATKAAVAGWVDSDGATWFFRGFSTELKEIPDILKDIVPGFPKLEPWTYANCAEVPACARALGAGAQLRDLVVKAIQVSTGVEKTPCLQCSRWLPRKE